MTRLDHVKLQAVLDGFDKQAFVPMPGGQAEPVAGAGMMTAAQVAPMGGAPGGDPMGGGAPPMDPAAGGMPMDPAAAGGAPMDPAAGGGMPMDPAAMGLPPELMGAMGGGSTITMTIPEFIQLIEVIRGGSGGGEAVPEEGKPKKKSEGEAGAPAAAAAPAAPDPIEGLNQKLDQVIAAVGGGAGAAMPPMPMPMDPAAAGGAPPAGGAPMPM